MSSVVSSSLELHGAAASSSPHSLLYLPSSSSLHEGAVVYASNCIINIATTPTFSDGNGNDIMLYNTKKTLRTCTLPRSDWIRSITAMALLRPVVVSEHDTMVSIIACAFSDGSITLWTHQKKSGAAADDVEQWKEIVLVGNTAEGSIGIDENCEKDKYGTSITDIDGVYSYNVIDGLVEATIITSSAKGVFSYVHPINLEGQITQSSNRSVIGTYPTSSIKVTTMDNQLLLAVGSALPRNNRIHFYTKCIDVGGSNDADEMWKHHGSVMGHLDWVSCLDWTVYEDAKGEGSTSDGSYGDSSLPTLMLASGSQDARIRLWRFHASTLCQDDELLDEEEDSEEDEEEDDEDLIEEGEARMYIRYTNKEGNIAQSAVTLEALLIGHEEHVTSVAWRPNSSAPCVISSSMDRSILIWMEEASEEQEDMRTTGTTTDVSDYRPKTQEGHGNVWVPVTRVGTAGGILGGSIGSSLLGFVNVLWTESGKQIIGHGFGGAIYFWSRMGMIAEEDGGISNGITRSDDTVTASSMERWRASPGITGHFRGCHDISWEPTCGMYLLSVGADQTCRLWSRLPPLKNDGTNDSTNDCTSRIWKEVGRPQVHGYDLNTVACIGTGKGEMIHRFVSGADEKEARAFDAPIQTMKLLRQLHGGVEHKEDSNGKEERVERAFIPSLGLSNRATAADAMEEGFETGITNDTENSDKASQGTGDSSSDPSNGPILDMIADSLPHERDLGVISLWPEVRKLHGHLTEMVCLVSTAGRCKKLDDQVLVASACKARTVEDAAIRVWNVESNMCLDVLKNGHKSTVVSLSFSPSGKFLASAGKDRRLCIWKRNTDTKTMPVGFSLSAIVESAHKRIIWSVDFCPCNENILATGSRDGKLKIWRVSEEDEESSVAVKEICCFEPAYKGDKKVVPITAIAFAPKTIKCNNEEHAILGVGLECGLIEVWAVPIDSTLSGYCATLLHSMPLTNCHIDSIKKLAWQPLKPSDSDDTEQMNSFGLTLASCGIDHGLRIYRLNFKSQCFLLKL